MSFLSPLFLVGLGAAAIPVLLHLLRRQPETRVSFPAVRLLQHAPVEERSRRRLRELLLLAVRVAALVLLSLAFARPYFAGAAAAGSAGVTVVAIDTSLSLDAPGRMAAAQALARDAIDRVPAGHLAAVLTFADVPVVVVSPSGDRELARSAVSGVQAGPGSARYRAALESASGLVAAHGDGTGRIVLVTDLQAGGWEQDDRLLLPDTVALEIQDVGPLPPNLAVVRARAEASRVVATISNTGDVPRQAEVTLSAGEERIGARTVTVAAGSSMDATFENVSADTVRVDVADAEGLQGDNTRYLVVARRPPPPVLVITGSGALERDAFYVQQALAAAGTAGPAYAVEGVAAPALSSREPGALSGYAAVLVLSTRGLDRRGRDLLAGFVADGGGLFLSVGPEVDGELASALLGIDQPIGIPGESSVRDPRGAARAVIAVDRRHPIFRAIGASLGPASFQRIAAVPADACEALARFTTGEPALLECLLGEGRALVFASDLNHAWNNLPRHAAFVPLLHESVRYLAGATGETDEIIVGQSPAAVRPGIVTMEGPDGLRRMAVNVDPRESEPARLSPIAFEQAITRVPAPPPAALVEARQQEEGQHIWRYALLAMIAMLVAESALASRAV